jgi:hypothetical protein
MFKSLGNLLVNPNIGMLFIDLHDKPRRLRVNGTASVDRRGEAGLLVQGRHAGLRSRDRSGRACVSGL